MFSKESTLSPPLNRSLGDEIVIRLRKAILSGQFEPDERLGEQFLAKTLGVSRGPIREALSQLEHEGLVIIRRNRGAFVARLSREDVNEVYSLRLALEKLAVQLAIQNASISDLDEMQAIIDTMASYLERGLTEQEAAELDVRFHDVMYRSANHRRLYDCWENIRPQIHVFLLSRAAANPDFRQYVVAGHQAILDAIRDKDEVRAIITLEDHIRMAYDRVIKSYSQPTTNGSTAT
jgi:DNA-binding GntR family transcriptional regulator